MPQPANAATAEKSFRTARANNEIHGRHLAETCNRILRRRGAATSLYAGPKALHVLGFGRGREGAAIYYDTHASQLHRVADTLGRAYLAELRARGVEDRPAALAAFGADIAGALGALGCTGKVGHGEHRPHRAFAADQDEENESDD